MNSYRPRQPLYYRPPPAKKPKFWRRLFLFFLILVSALVGLHSFGDMNLSALTAKPKKVAAAPAPVLTAAQQAAMAVQINSVIQSHPNMDIGVAIEDLNSAKAYHYGIGNPFVAASVSKVLTATLFLHEVETGQQTFSQTLSYGSAKYELQQMIEQSDNTAWQDFNGLLTHNGLQNYAASIGLSNYDPDQNTLTVDDITLLLGKLYKGQLLNPSDTSLLLSYMKDADFDSYIPASVPAGVKVYHKAGWLSDRVHDSAIIDNGQHPYVLVIFTKMDDGSNYDDTEGHVVFSAITTATVQAFLK